jgi:hypothetical protein
MTTYPKAGRQETETQHQPTDPLNQLKQVTSRPPEPIQLGHDQDVAGL